MFDPKQVSTADLAQMFERSVIMYEKRPVYVTVPDERKNLRFIHLGTDGSEVTSRHITDKAWDFRPISLGACKVGNYSAYLYRVPYRQYKQGTCYRNIGCVAISEDSRNLPRQESTILQTFNFKSLEECIMGSYESFEKVLKEFDKDASIISRPVSKDFSITRELELYFRDAKVGMINEENGKAMFKRGSKFLSSLFEGAINVG